MFGLQPSMVLHQEVEGHVRYGSHEKKKMEEQQTSHRDKASHGAAQRRSQLLPAAPWLQCHGPPVHGSGEVGVTGPVATGRCGSGRTPKQADPLSQCRIRATMARMNLRNGAATRSMTAARLGVPAWGPRDIEKGDYGR